MLGGGKRPRGRPDPGRATGSVAYSPPGSQTTGSSHLVAAVAHLPAGQGVGAVVVEVVAGEEAGGEVLAAADRGEEGGGLAVPWPADEHGGGGALPRRVPPLGADAGRDALDAALGELRAAGWRAPEDPDSDEDTDLDGRGHLADRLADEVDWLRQCAGWLRQLDGGGYPPAVNLRPSADWPDRAVVAVDLARVAAVIDRIAADVGEPAPAPRGPDPSTP